MLVGRFLVPGLLIRRILGPRLVRLLLLLLLRTDHVLGAPIWPGLVQLRLLRVEKGSVPLRESGMLARPGLPVKGCVSWIERGGRSYILPPIVGSRIDPILVKLLRGEAIRSVQGVAQRESIKRAFPHRRAWLQGRVHFAQIDRWRQLSQLVAVVRGGVGLYCWLEALPRGLHLHGEGLLRISVP